MKVNIFTAADYVDSSGGRLTIVGAFDNIESEKCPFTFKPFGMAIKLMAEPRDRDKTYDGSLVVRKSGSKKLLAKIQLSLNFQGQTPQKTNSLNMALNLLGAKFDSFGTYFLELQVGSRMIASTKISVVKKPQVDNAKKVKKRKKKKGRN